MTDGPKHLGLDLLRRVTVRPGANLPRAGETGVVVGVHLAFEGHPLVDVRFSTPRGFGHCVERYALTPGNPGWLFPVDHAE